MEGEVALLIPISFILSVAGVVALAFTLRHRGRVEMQHTIRAAIDKGQQLSPELIDRLGEGLRRPDADLRRGIVLIAAGLGLAAFGAVLGEEDAVQPFLAMGAVPFLIGVAYLGLWRLLPRS